MTRDILTASAALALAVALWGLVAALRWGAYQNGHAAGYAECLLHISTGS